MAQSEEKLKKALVANKAFLLRRLQRDWQETQKAARKEELIQTAKRGSLIIARVLLTLVAVGGVLTVAAVAPNIFGALGRVDGRSRFFDAKSFRNSLHYLKKERFIHVTGRKDAYSVSLSSEGEKLVLSRTFKDLRITKQKQWDGMWRVVAFDIPNTHKWERDVLRQRLRMMGFYSLQKSMFAYPYPCEEEVGYITKLLSIGAYIRFMRVAEIVDDLDAKEFFKL